MRKSVVIGIIAASMLAASAIAVDAQQGKGGGGQDRDQQMDRDRTYDHDRTYDRDRIQDRTRLDVPDQDRDRDKDQDRDQDRIHQDAAASLKNADIYGSALMTEQERNQYRHQLQSMESAQEREQFQAQHEKQMQERAQKQGVDLVPPGQGPIYGGELMTVQERNQYREQLRNMESAEEAEKFQAQHREKMRQRAEALEREIEEAE